MKEIFKIFKFLLIMCGVFGANEDKVKTLSVIEGDSVTLNPDLTQIQGINLILWRFGSQGSTIARIVLNNKTGNKITYEDDMEIFRDRVQLDQTGSLTIINMKTNHSGLYKAVISHSKGELLTQFFVTVYESPSVVDAVKGEMKIMSVTEGDSVTLQTDVTELLGNELIVWRFGDEGKLIAKHDIEAKTSPLYDTDERFRDRLQLNDQTGSLIITNSRITDSGLYKVKISSNKQTLHKRFTVTVSEPGVSPGAAAGIVVVVLLVFAAAAAGGVFYYRPKITNLPSQTWSKFPGRTVTLEPGTEIQTGDEIQWLYGADTPIAKMKKGTKDVPTYDCPDMIFKNRLELNETTGSLKIKFINTEHAGLYTLKIRRGRETLNKKFQVSVYVKYEEAIKGDRVHLLTGLTDVQPHDEIKWLFKDTKQYTLIAKIKQGIDQTYDRSDEIFKDSLQLATKTGDLIIKSSKPEHAGCYKLRIHNSKGETNRTFIVSIRGSAASDDIYWGKETDDEDNIEEETGTPFLRVGVDG